VRVSQVMDNTLPLPYNPNRRRPNRGKRERDFWHQVQLRRKKKRRKETGKKKKKLNVGAHAIGCLKVKCGGKNMHKRAEGRRNFQRGSFHPYMTTRAKAKVSGNTETHAKVAHDLCLSLNVANKKGGRLEWEGKGGRNTERLQSLPPDTAKRI